jgi:Tfp pilus assembly protein PilZ
MYNNIATNLLNLIIKDKITVYSNYFQFTTPFAIFVDGFVNPTIAENTRIDLNVTATVNSASVIVYYNNSVVNLPVTPTVTINTGTNSTLNYDISYNKLSLANNGTPPDSDNYHMLLYMGNITVSNLYLFTAPSYVYNIKLRVEVILTKPAIYSSYFTTTNYGVICNIDPTRLITQKNCIINAEPAIMIENNGFTFSG